MDLKSIFFVYVEYFSIITTFVIIYFRFKKIPLKITPLSCILNIVCSFLTLILTKAIEQSLDIAISIKKLLSPQGVSEKEVIMQ